MATSVNTDLCNICEGLNETRQAIKWCPECNEKLCKDCYGNHIVSTLSRNHEVLDIEQYRKFLESVLAIKNICDEHNVKFTNFCPQHDQVCCPDCISMSGSHSKCTTVVLERVTRTAKTSVLLQSVEETLENLKDNLKTIINDRKTNLQKLHDQKAKILLDVIQMKEKIIQHLNDFEKNLFYDLDKTIMKNSRILTSEIASFEERLQQAEKMSDKSDAMKQYGSDLQIFIGSRSMDQEVHRLNNNVKELVENMKLVGVTLQWNPKVNEVSEGISSLGSILEQETPMAVVLTSDLGTQVQVPSPQSFYFDGIKAKLKTTFQITDKKVKVRGCSIFPNNNTIFVDNRNEKLIFFKENFKKEKVIPTLSGPCDVTIIDDNTVAVSTYESVEVINITTNAVEKTIKTGRCHGLEYYNGSLFCCVLGKGILSVDLSTSSSSSIATVEETEDRWWFNWYYCTVNDDMIYTTRSANHTVTCYTMGGDKVWEYTDPLVINDPLGVTVDNSSNVYIASYTNHSIVVLSPDGQRHKTLLTKEDGMCYPWALYFDRSRNQLLVGNRDGSVLLFSI